MDAAEWREEGDHLARIEKELAVEDHVAAAGGRRDRRGSEGVGGAPQIAETLRLVLGWAWTYVIVAELVGADSGIGHMIMDSQRFLDTGQMIFGIFIIGVIGLITDFAFRAINLWLFPWYAGR